MSPRLRLTHGVMVVYFSKRARKRTTLALYWRGSAFFEERESQLRLLVSTACWTAKWQTCTFKLDGSHIQRIAHKTSISLRNTRRSRPEHCTCCSVGSMGYELQFRATPCRVTQYRRPRQGYEYDQDIFASRLKPAQPLW